MHSLKFNAVNDNVAWFSKENLNFATWNDLKNTSSLQKFALQQSMRVLIALLRISKEYDAGCGNDVGWLMISTDTNPCRFAKKKPLSIL